MIGWRSTKQDCQINNYESVISCRKGDIVRALKWPREGII